MGLGPGLCRGQSSVLMKAGVFLCSHFWVVLALWAGAESCWKTPSGPLKRIMLKGFTSPYSTSSWYTQAPHQFSHLSRKKWRGTTFSQKIKRCHPLMGHPPLNHDVEWLYCSSMLKIFSSVKRVFMCPFSVCHWKSRCALVCQISFKAWVRRCPFNCQYALIPDEAWHQSGWYVQPLGHNLLFLERISAKPLPHCFESGHSPHFSRVSWPSSVFNPAEFLIMFTCPIDEHSWNFRWF